MFNYKIRFGNDDDLLFLQSMLYEAVFWDPKAERIPKEKLLALPDIAKIFRNWNQRDGDFSLIAVNDRNDSIGAAWYRFFTAEDSSFGYVDDHTPEIGIALLADYRRRGIGTALMKNLIDHALRIGIKKLSLSVDPNNYALILYQKLGFKKVSESGTSLILYKLLSSCDCPPG